MKINRFALAVILAAGLLCLLAATPDQAEPKKIVGDKPEAKKKPKVIAALLSVSNEKDSKKFPDENIDLVELNGKPMIWWVYQGLKNCSAVDEIFVVGPEESLKATGEKFDKDNPHFIVSKEDAINKLLAVMEKAGEDDIIINIPSDLPLVTPNEMTTIIKNVSDNPGGDYYVYMVKEEDYLKKYPDKKRVCFQFAEGSLTPAHVQAIMPSFFKKNKEQATEFYKMRRSPFGLIKMLGTKLVGRYLRGKLSLKDIESRTKDKMNCVMRISIISEPDYATDLQAPAQKEFIEKSLKNKEKEKLTDQHKDPDCKKESSKSQVVIISASAAYEQPKE